MRIGRPLPADTRPRMDWIEPGDMLTYHHLTVFEEEEPDALQSPILGPDGKPITYYIESQKLGYIGFFPPAGFPGSCFKEEE